MKTIFGCKNQLLDRRLCVQNLFNSKARFMNDAEKHSLLNQLFLIPKLQTFLYWRAKLNEFEWLIPCKVFKMSSFFDCKVIDWFGDEFLHTRGAESTREPRPWGLDASSATHTQETRAQAFRGQCSA